MSANNLCLNSVLKPGMVKVKQKTINKKNEETLITSPGMIMEKNFTVC